MVSDPSRLNEWVRKPVSTQAPPWEKVRKIPRGIKYFGVFDALKAYYQVELDEESKDLTTFLTPFGRMRYNRLPMGYNISSNIYDTAYGRAVDHVKNTERVCEDTLVYAKSKEEYLKVSEEYFKACADNKH